MSWDEITSCGHNKLVLQWLCDGSGYPELDRYPRIKLNFHKEIFGDFAHTKCDDLGWLGYFIGGSEHLRDLEIEGSPRDEEEERRIIHALSDGIARNQSIQKVSLHNLSDDGFNAITIILGNLTS